MSSMIERAEAAGRDDRLADGQLYLDLAQALRNTRTAYNTELEVNDRLRRELREARDANWTCEVTIKELQAENEALLISNKLKSDVIDTKEADVNRLDERIKRLRAALEEIATSKFCNYENTGSGQYGIGVTDGHRYCANIAKKALDSSETEK